MKLSHEAHQIVNDAALQTAKTAQHLLAVAVVWAACAGLHPSSSTAYLILTIFLACVEFLARPSY